jgi:hypothetical protein
MEVGGQPHACATFHPGERAPCSSWIGGWVGPRTGLNVVGKRKIPHSRESNAGHSARRPHNSIFVTCFNQALCIFVADCICGYISSKKKPIISLCTINRLGFVMETQGNLCEAEKEIFNITEMNFILEEAKLNSMKEFVDKCIESV